MPQAQQVERRGWPASLPSDMARNLSEEARVSIPPGCFENNNGLIGSFYVRRFELKAGETLEGHRHYIDHASFFLQGTAQITWEDRDGNSGKLVVSSPNFIQIGKDEKHGFLALEDCVWYCIFSEAEGEAVMPEGHAYLYNSGH